MSMAGCCLTAPCSGLARATCKAPQAALTRPLRVAGGAGPYDPRVGLIATLYLPPEAGPVTDGMVAEVAGSSYVLSQCRWAADPTSAAGGLGCWVATCTGTDTWGP